MPEIKRRLSDFDFSKQGCHVSLVNKEVGGAANMRTALVMKALSSAEDSTTKETNVSEMIEKSAAEVMIQKAVEEAIAPLQEVLKAKDAEIAAFKQEKQEAILKSRKETLDNVVGTAKSDELMAVCADMNEQQFEVIVKSLGVAVEKEAQSDAFKEIGVSGEPDKTAAVEDPTAAILKAKYSK